MKYLTIFTALTLTFGSMGGLFSTTDANAANLSFKSGNSNQLYGIHTTKRKSGNPSGFKAAKKRVLDTCKGGDKACIDGLIARCDEANGGLSTEPDGGVDCYVVGIHDRNE